MQASIATQTPVVEVASATQPSGTHESRAMRAVDQDRLGVRVSRNLEGPMPGWN